MSIAGGLQIDRYQCSALLLEPRCCHLFKRAQLLKRNLLRQNSTNVLANRLLDGDCHTWYVWATVVDSILVSCKQGTSHWKFSEDLLPVDKPSIFTEMGQALENINSCIFFHISKNIIDIHLVWGGGRIGVVQGDDDDFSTSASSRRDICICNFRYMYVYMSLYMCW